MTSMAPKPFQFKNRPAWRASDTTTADSTKVFDSTGNYEAILKEQRRERERRRAKARARAERKEEEGRDTKRRRLSTEVDLNDNDVSDSGSLGSHNGIKRSLTPPPSRPVTRSTPKKDQTSTDGLPELKSKYKSPRKEGVKQAAAIQLDDDIQINESASAPPPTRHEADRDITQPIPDEGDPESEDDDPYIRELKRKAREKAHSLRPGRDVETSTTLDEADGREVSTFSPAPEGRDEPMVKFMITTMIPNARSLIVSRKVSQDLGFVREYFCKHMELSKFITEKVFLTWRGNRLFDSTTARSLLQQLKKEARIPTWSDEDPSHGKLEIEATTQEIVDHKERQKRQQLEEQERLANGNSEAADAAVPEAEVEKVKKIMIKLKSPAHEMNLRVRPENTIETVMKAFQKTQNVDEDKTCWLVFDGDRLDLEETAESVGLEDGDVVEVHIH